MNREETKAVLKGKNVLIAEDQVIPAMGLEVKLRYSGVDAIRICDRMAACMSVIEGDFTPDAAIIDVDMAGRDGRELARELQSRGIPFMFHTGSSEAESIAADFDGAPVVMKPSTEDQVLSTLAGLFEPANTETSPEPHDQPA